MRRYRPVQIQKDDLPNWKPLHWSRVRSMARESSNHSVDDLQEEVVVHHQRSQRRAQPGRSDPASRPPFP